MTEEEIKSAKIIEDAEKIETLLNSDGWALFIEKIKERYRDYLRQLRRITKEELEALQARISEIEMILEIPKDFLRAKKKEEESGGGKPG